MGDNTFFHGQIIAAVERVLAEAVRPRDWYWNTKPIMDARETLANLTVVLLDGGDVELARLAAACHGIAFTYVLHVLETDMVIEPFLALAAATADYPGIWDTDAPEV